MTTSLPPEDLRSASPIVLVHGDFSDGFGSWGKACASIGRRWRTVVVDRPGFDEELPESARFSIGGEARVLLAVADAMRIRSCHLVGHSYGALIALEMAVMRPEIVRSLHLIEPPLLDLLPEEPLVQELDRHVRWIVEHHAEIGDEAATEAFFTMIGAGRTVERLRGTPEWDRLCGYATRFARGESASAYPSESLASLMETIPVALYTGSRSDPALRQITAALAERIKGARLLEVPEAGHAVQMASVDFVEALLAVVHDADLT